MPVKQLSAMTQIILTARSRGGGTALMPLPLPSLPGLDPDQGFALALHSLLSTCRGTHPASIIPLKTGYEGVLRQAGGGSGREADDHENKGMSKEISTFPYRGFFKEEQSEINFASPGVTQSSW